MNKRLETKMVREGEYVAEVQVELVETEDEWSPYLSLQDAQKLDTVREALRMGDLLRVSKFARVYRLMPVAV